MSFSDSDWTSDTAAAATRRDGALAWVLALGIVIGAAGATVVLYAMDRLPGRASPSPSSSSSNAPVAALPAPLPVLIETQPPAAGARGPASASAGSDDTAASSAGTASAPSPRPSEDELRRKERAWARFYQRPASCEGNPSTDQLIECANHFIRSKREFDARWKAGTL